MAEEAYYRLRTERPAAPNGCPVDHGFSPFSENYVADPYTVLRDLRANSPLFYAEKLGCLVLTRMEDVAEVFRRSDVFGAANVQDPVLPICDGAAEILSVIDYDPIAVLSNRAPPDHTRIRKHTHAGFSSRRMKVMEPFIRRRCEALVETMRRNGAPADFVAALGHPLPGETIFRFIGFPEADDQDLKDWTTNRLAFTWGMASEKEQIAIAKKMLAYWRYCVAFVAERQRNPGDDFTSELLGAHAADPDDLGYREVVSVVYGLSFAGHEIVSNLLSNGLINLLSAPGLWPEICRNPALIPNAVEEVLRCNSPQTSWRRVALEDTELAGYKIPAGTQMFLSLGSANHDESLFDDPGTFDIHRTNARAHISFGRGIHFCLGNRLAMLEATIALETLTRELPSLALVADQSFSYVPNFTFRGPDELWLTWRGEQCTTGIGPPPGSGRQ
ncbi:MAG: cytochrome P450 [Rhodospirillaceae bacterium]|jgi:cytochrome P450|nr:cytochrome P450 [Rhodospirillaceae bacterium]MBT5079971.1 cytochrome P450 [Rhodospirillaceae bacterium]MBT5525993.1 cytochrome P450 [Rhodospirillaceae bacterium]MBT5881782.1 cytochrome P450 [Rhodospirillaceae bacterium]MBT6588147.1 cytochrome P450 [Rhodospirillaceae bacterium]